MANNEMLYRGDELTLAPALVVSKNTVAGGLVQSGEPCMCGDLALVAMTTAYPAGQYLGSLAAPANNLNGVPATDVVAFKCKGVFLCTVHPAAALHPGKSVYFDPATGILSDDNTKSFYGYYVPMDGANVNLNAGVDNLNVPVKLKH